jgi:hypothetical protein
LSVCVHSVANHCFLYLTLLLFCLAQSSFSLEVLFKKIQPAQPLKITNTLQVAFFPG